MSVEIRNIVIEARGIRFMALKSIHFIV